MEDYEKIKSLYLKKDFNIVELDCNYVNTGDDIFKLFSSSLKFPSYLEWSWNTFFNNINNLSWLKSKNSVILIKNIEKFMQADFFKSFIMCLIDAHVWWKRGGVHFNSIIFTSNIKNENICEILEDISKREYFKIRNVEDYEKIKKIYKNKKFNTIEFDGKVINTEKDVFNLFLSSLKFPSYFGNNWDAFWDCITDISWLKVKDFVIFIKNIENTLDKDYFETFIHSLIDAHVWWKRENVIFDLFVFTSNKKTIAILENFLKQFTHGKVKEVKS